MPLRPHAEDKNLNMLHLDVIESQTCQCNTKQKKKSKLKSYLIKCYLWQNSCWPQIRKDLKTFSKLKQSSLWLQMFFIFIPFVPSSQHITKQSNNLTTMRAMKEKR